MQDSSHGIRAAAAICLLTGFGILSGCANDSRAPNATPPPAASDINLEAANGGFTAAPESPAFGDSNLMLSLDQEVSVEDAIEAQPEVRDWIGRPGSRVYVLTVLWGMLQNASDPSDPGPDGTDHDWSGRIEAGNGAVALRSVISFERADGDSILPRSSRQILAWKSHTGVGFDGVRLLLVHSPAPATDPNRGQDSLQFSAGPYSRVFTWRELEKLDDEVQIDAIGNRISFQAFRLDPTTSHPAGFLRGRWDSIAVGDSLGRFQGVWVGERGQSVGFFQGVYGTRANGDQVFFGKYIDDHGAFLGLLRGTWGVSDLEARGSSAVARLGWFRGEWVNADQSREGAIEGRFRAPADRKGFLTGRWCRGDCIDLP